MMYLWVEEMNFHVRLEAEAQTRYEQVYSMITEDDDKQYMSENTPHSQVGEKTTNETNYLRILENRPQHPYDGKS